MESYRYVDGNGLQQHNQQSQARYDALNRITHIDDDLYSLRYEYDEIGNRRRVVSDYQVRVEGELEDARWRQDYWYDYDVMNRFSITQGSLIGDEIVAGGSGYAIQYNGLDQRTRVDSANSVETYAYDDYGHLTKTLVFNAGTSTSSESRDCSCNLAAYTTSL